MQCDPSAYFRSPRDGHEGHAATSNDRDSDVEQTALARTVQVAKVWIFLQRCQDTLVHDNILTREVFQPEPLAGVVELYRPQKVLSVVRFPLHRALVGAIDRLLVDGRVGRQKLGAAR